MNILFFLLWVALNGRITLEIVVFGIVISLAINVFMKKCLEYNPVSPKLFFSNTIFALQYVIILIVEIVKAGCGVLRFVVRKNIQIEPQIVVFKVPIKNETLKTILSSSITLTPGTITLNIEDDYFYVHALDYTMGEGLDKSVFVRLLMRIESNLERNKERYNK